MAEICYKCFVELLASTEEEENKKNLIISKEPGFCDWCEEVKHIVIRYKKFYLFKEAIKKYFRR